MSLADREEDYRFLHSVLMEKKLHLLFKIHECLRRFEKRTPVAAQQRAACLASDLAEELKQQNRKDEVQELLGLFFQPHFKRLLSVHDAVAQSDFGPTLPPVPDDVLEEDEDSFQIVSLVKTKEPLGATIRRDQSTGAIVVARIMRGGPADRSGLIREGDELKEVNGVSLEHRKPKEVPLLLARSQGEVSFTVIPASTEEDMSSDKKLFVRALFDYDPSEDPAVPCKDAAVAFKRGDVLQVVSMEDDTWWQARHLRDGVQRAGLIPSQELHERRVALQRPEALFKPRPVKPPEEEEEAEERVDYGAISGIRIAGLRRSFRLGRKSNRVGESARSRRWSAGVPPTYVEVIPYRRDLRERGRLVILVGPDGVGVNELKKRILISDPDRYGVAVPYTTREKTRPEEEGVDYHFVSLHTFEEGVLSRRFIDYGRHNGHYYGTSLDSVRRAMAAGKVCLLDMHPSKIKHVYTFEFKPYVVLVKPPRVEELRLAGRRAKFTCSEEEEEDFQDMIDSAETMEDECGHLLDKVIVSGDVAVAFGELKADLRRVEAADVRWIPAEWVRSSPGKTREERRPLGRLDASAEAAFAGTELRFAA
ncbi:MAGUK p55 subfamily member 7-like [Brachionichthys hirsutus]|uniref:MAGUK p55 subfamily member 7-like n=1 Tax=Brachionichthys hirsutus TaxID=412623 RepID=UPI003604D3DC